MAHRKIQLGQHFLINSQVADRIVEAARLKAGDAAVEIGPGKGILTERLVASGARVAAVELDARLCEDLAARFHLQEEGMLRLIHADFLQVSLSELPAPCVFVANLP